MRVGQLTLFPVEPVSNGVSDGQSSTFVKNMSLPVHRWFRYSAGFSGEWAGTVIGEAARKSSTRVFDPFAGSATTLVAAENLGVPSWGIDSHPFVARVAKAKLAWRSDPEEYLKRITHIVQAAKGIKPSLDGYPPLIRRCYDDDPLAELDRLKTAYKRQEDRTPPSELAWLTLVSILRPTSKAGTAQWQYVLPNKQKRSPANPLVAFRGMSATIHADMRIGKSVIGPRAEFLASDARSCEGVPDRFATLVVTSPPYPNNYDYADATRLEMSFMGEITGWGDLQNAVRRHLIRSCSQHVPEKAVDLHGVLAEPCLAPIRDELSLVCEQLAEVRQTKGGRKTYHLMVCCYFHDLALVWRALRRVCDSPSLVCFVIGDAAPYGVYVPAVPWLGALALAAGFKSYRFEKTRDRNLKWKNRKHRVPLQEGRLWVQG